MECSCKHLKEKKSVALSNQKQVEKLNKIENTSTEEEILCGLQTKDHSLQPSILDITCKRSTQRKRVSSVSKENTQCKCIKTSDDIKKKSICTMSKKEEGLLGKIKLMIGEQMDILNNDFFNQKLESLNRRLEQVQCKKTHEEVAKTLLKKVSKLERRINAMIAFQEQVFSKMVVHQTMLPSAYYQNTVLNQLGPSAFSPGIINIPTSSSNTLLLSPYTGFISAHVSEYISSDEVILVSVESRNSATANISAIPANQTSTQAEMSATVQSQMKEGKLQVISLTEENHNYSKDFQAISTSSSTAKEEQRGISVQSLLKNSKTPLRILKPKVADMQNPKGIALSWTLQKLSPSVLPCSYHSYLFHENLSSNSAPYCKKIGKPRALPLSVACCLPQVLPEKYYLVIQ